MSVTVKYFASLREHVGVAQQQFLLPVSGCNAIELWVLVNPSIKLADNSLVAINQNYAAFDAVVNDGDEIAFFPPVAGG
ncbi:MoaD/ThiS family protein [Gammaproteobacteria bacterium AH-315-M22]|nr:MoaD/ThiS family protein [Gammaproteobacteria bacterium AH-315-M22]